MTFKNNPFNIRSTSSQWQGLVGSKRGFCEFDSLENGVRVAIYLLIKTYPKYGCDTIESVITRFAPPSENDTARYIDYVCLRCDAKPTDKIRDVGLYNVLSAMAMIESHFVLPYNLFKRAYERV